MVHDPRVRYPLGNTIDGLESLRGYGYDRHHAQMLELKDPGCEPDSARMRPQVRAPSSIAILRGSNLFGHRRSG